MVQFMMLLVVLLRWNFWNISLIAEDKCMTVNTKVLSGREFNAGHPGYVQALCVLRYDPKITFQINTIRNTKFFGCWNNKSRLSHFFLLKRINMRCVFLMMLICEVFIAYYPNYRFWRFTVACIDLSIFDNILYFPYFTFRVKWPS